MFWTVMVIGQEHWMHLKRATGNYLFFGFSVGYFLYGIKKLRSIFIDSYLARVLRRGASFMLGSKSLDDFDTAGTILILFASPKCNLFNMLCMSWATAVLKE